MLNLRQVQSELETAIATGSQTVEQYHRQFATTALEMVGQVLPLGETGSQIKTFNEQAITGLYDFIRGANLKGGELARTVLDRIDPQV